MAITIGSRVTMSMVMQILGQTMINEWSYRVDGSAFLVEPVQLAEAWWNHVKDTYRALIVDGSENVFRSVRLLEMNNPTGDYAEYAIPTLERDGTRPVGSLGPYMPPFNAVGVRLTVGTRATRPGQKRLPGLTEGDNVNGFVEAPFIALVNAHMDIMSEPMVMGAPAATIGLVPYVFRRNADGEVTVDQPVLGYVTNTDITSQNSRKYGRGI